MQATQKQIDANQANARKSTGPKDASRTRLNGLAHGLTSNTLILPWEDQTVFDQLLEDFSRRYKPADRVEAILVREAAEAQWLLQRTRRLEANLFNMLARQEHVDAEAEPGDLHAGEAEVISFLKGGEHFDRYRRYETARLRAWERAFQRLEQMLGHRVHAATATDQPLPAPIECLADDPEGNRLASLRIHGNPNRIPALTGVRLAPRKPIPRAPETSPTHQNTQSGG